mgnify:CR=1 FL=1
MPIVAAMLTERPEEAIVKAWIVLVPAMLVSAEASAIQRYTSTSMTCARVKAVLESGPAILQISSYWRPGDAITLDIAPDFDALVFLKERRLSRAKAEPKTVLAEFLPARLAQG